jgi:biotin carboxyl carrier protein
MSLPDAGGRLRLAVSGPTDATFELGPGDGAEATRAIRVSPVAPSSDDTTLGRRRFEVIVDGWRFEVAVEPAARAVLREKARRVAEATGATAALVLRAQIPGRVTRVWVGDGDDVERGQRLLAIEAMKMENEVRAARAGKVAGIAVHEGDLVELHDELLSIV